MIKRCFIILTISRDSLDYDILLNYLRSNINVYSLYIISHGFFLELVYEFDEEYDALMNVFTTTDVTNVITHPVLDKTFLKDILHARDYKHKELYDNDDLDST